MQERSMAILRCDLMVIFFAILDTIESDDEGYIENTMIDSDTVFVAEDESVISTNIIGKDETGDQSSLVSVPQASIHI